MEKLREMEPEPYHPEILAEEDPRYLRRQKPLEIRRRKFGQRAHLYRRLLLGGMAAVAAGGLSFQAWRFLFHSPRFVLADPEQILLSGNHYVPREAVLEKFSADRGHNTLRIPLAERRRALEEIPWVEQARVRRVLPSALQVELMERQPVAFLRLSTELALIDADGVVLERPLQGEFHFPVVVGIGQAMPQEERAKRMRLFVQFLKEIELVRPGATEQVSEVDLSDGSDVRATLAGMPELGSLAQGGQDAVVVRFGDGDFLNKFRVLVENLSQWRASVGRVESLDLRFHRQAVVNPEAPSGPAAAAQSLGAAGPAQRVPR